jgi:prepilin-type N-terminal cleavage/methylation domain-containing protein
MKNKKGFTFVELMIALTIFALISLGIYATFSTGLNAWRRGEDATRLQQEARWALDKIAQELRGAVIYNYGDSYPELGSFLGERSKISFLSLVYSPVSKISEVKKITYSLEVPDYGEIHKTVIGTHQEKLSKVIVNYEENQAPLESLQRKEEALLQTLETKEITPAKSEPLTNLVKSGGLSFSYAFKQGAGEEETTVWKESWEDKTKLPQGVKITLILQNPKNIKEEAIFTKTVFLEQGSVGQSSVEQ